MVGDQIATIEGPVKNRILPAQGASPVFESSFEGAGHIVDVGVQGLATYTSVMNIDGTLYGECPNQGLLMAPDGVATLEQPESGNSRTPVVQAFAVQYIFRHLLHPYRI